MWQASLGCTCYPHQAYEAPPICSLTNSKPSAGGGAAPNGKPECACSRVMLPAKMDAPVAANGHAAEIDILLNARLHVVALHLFVDDQI